MSKIDVQSPASIFAAEDEEEKVRASKEKSKKKVHSLLETLRAETETYAKTIASQIRAVAYANGILSKTTPLIYEG